MADLIDYVRRKLELADDWVADLDMQRIKAEAEAEVYRDLLGFLTEKSEPQPLPAAQTEAPREEPVAAVVTPASVGSVAPAETARAPVSAEPIPEAKTSTGNAVTANGRDEAGTDGSGEVSRPSAAAETAHAGEAAATVAASSAPITEKAEVARPAEERAHNPNSSAPITGLEKSVARLLRQNPSWNARMIARNLDVHTNKIIAVGKRLGLSIPNDTKKPEPAFQGEAALRQHYKDVRARLGAA